MRSAMFGRLLKAAIGSIAALEHTTGPVIEDQIGSRIGLSASSIQRYKAGHIPPDLRTIELLAALAVQRGYLNRVWLVAFLRAASHPAAAQVIEQLYPSPEKEPLSSRTASIYSNLPAPPYTHFVTRTDAYAEVSEGLSQRSAVVVLVGIGGVGKTSLAHEIAS